MALEVGQLLGIMTKAGEGLASGIWKDIQTFAVPELQKIAVQMTAIETGMLAVPPHFSQEEAGILLNMQVQATVAVIVGMTSLTLLAVQDAINQIIAGVKGLVNAALKFPLIP